MTRRAIIGHTGFVGSNLTGFGHYDRLFNSSNSNEMRGQSFDEVICCGVSAVKWRANEDPNADWLRISALIDNIDQLQAGRFILISTIDVYQPPVGVTEQDPTSPVGGGYGLNRARLERHIRDKFRDYLILRLPGLYGRGLRKNAIYDLYHDNMVDAINPVNTFQWYDVRRLEEDMQSILKEGIQICNITAEPVSMELIGNTYFPGKLRRSSPGETGVRYDVRTNYAAALGGSGHYHFDAAAVLSGIGHCLEEGL